MPHRTQSLIRGAAFIVLGELCFASMGVGIRAVSTELPNEVIVFARNLIGLTLLLPWLARRGIGGLATSVPALHLLRAAAGLAAMYCFFYAIAAMPLAEAMLLKLTAPIFMPIIAVLWLHERVTPLLALALGVGFAGVAVILDPSVGDGAVSISPVAVIGLLGGVLAALAKVTVRRLSRTEPPTRIVFYFALVAMSISALPLAWSWQTPSPAAALGLLAIGVAATLGQLALTRGLSLAPASRMGVFGYSAVVFGAAYGWLIWDEPLTWSTIIGTLLIACAGLLAARATHRPRGLVATPAGAPIAPATDARAGG
jgi:drug/metabolite transporter (DMT)-like permease